MIEVQSNSDIRYVAAIDGHATGVHLTLLSDEGMSETLMVNVPEDDLRRALAEFLHAKFRPLLSPDDNWSPRMAALLWLRGVLNDDGRFPPRLGTDRPAIVEPERSQGPDFAV